MSIMIHDSLTLILILRVASGAFSVGGHVLTLWAAPQGYSCNAGCIVASRQRFRGGRGEGSERRAEANPMPFRVNPIPCSRLLFPLFNAAELIPETLILVFVYPLTLDQGIAGHQAK